MWGTSVNKATLLGTKNVSSKKQNQQREHLRGSMHIRIYYCKCGDKVEIEKGESKQCDCGHIYGSWNYNPSNYVNMRSKWSKTTQIEFSEKSHEDYMKERNS